MVDVEYCGNTSNWHKPIYLIEGSFWCLFTLRTLLFLFMFINLPALSAKYIMWVKPEEHLESGCMNIKHLPKRMDKSHQSHVTLK